MTTPIRTSPEPNLESPIDEAEFSGLLEIEVGTFFRLMNALLARTDAGKLWKKTHYGRLVSETESLESFLDDYGARYNRTFAEFTELIASLRWFAHAGQSISHLLGRLPSYQTDSKEGSHTFEDALADIREGAEFLHKTALVLLVETQREAAQLGVKIPSDALPDSQLMRAEIVVKLPRNVGQEVLDNEEQKIAEVATKFLAAADMVARTGIREINDDRDRHDFLGKVSTEEKARVYEATVHNLQSTYDTHIRNTVLEGSDPRLPQLRGNAAAALHLLQAVTHLAHFLERHEGDTRPAHCHRRVFDLIDRSEVERVTVNLFLLRAHRFLQTGTGVAEDLLPAYMNVQELVVELPEDTHLHARPAALIVAIVNHHSTPVELELGGQRCDAGSILKILVTAGSKPDERSFLFRGDERPLEDIRQLFLHGLGEEGMDRLPDRLDYLRHR